LKQLGQRIKKLREIKGLNQTQLAGLINVDPSHISKLESGYTLGSISTLQKLANALGISIVELLYEPQKGATGTECY